MLAYHVGVISVGNTSPKTRAFVHPMVANTIERNCRRFKMHVGGFETLFFLRNGPDNVLFFAYGLALPRFRESTVMFRNLHLPNACLSAGTSVMKA